MKNENRKLLRHTAGRENAQLTTAEQVLKCAFFIVCINEFKKALGWAFEALNLKNNGEQCKASSSAKEPYIPDASKTPGPVFV